MTSLNIHMKSQTQSHHPISEQERSYWDRWQDTNSTNAWAIQRSKTLDQMLQPILAERSLKILDSGCGNGWYSVRLSKYGKVTAIDLSELHMAEAAHKHPEIEFIAGDFIEYDFPQNYFDLVVSQQVLPHVYDQQRYIEKVAELLIPGGHLALTMNNKFVVERMSNYNSHVDQGHKENWLALREFKRLARPYFKIRQTKSIPPMGDSGVLRVLNSPKVNHLLNHFFKQETILKAKELMRLGYVNLIIAQKRK